MTRRDRGLVATLGLAFAALAIVVALPAAPRSGSIGSPAPTGSDVPWAIFREGIVGSPSSINPLTARTAADRDLAALIFSGLTRLGPDDTVLPDLATSWTMDATGGSWTFHLRPDARWQDGVPVTADDIVFTVGVLHDPAYAGPLVGSWREVTATQIDPSTVRFDLATPLGGFLQATTIGILPAHLLRDVPVAKLADDRFSVEPVGSGPYALVQWDTGAAQLVPAGSLAAPAEPTGSSASVPGVDAPTGPSASAPGVDVPTGPSGSAGAGPSASVGAASLPELDFTFFTDATALADAYRAGEIDDASGLGPAQAASLAALPGSHLLTYPGTTFTSLAVNLRPGSTALRPARVRRALLEILDRMKLVADVYRGAATRADSAIPPTSWAFDAKASAPVATSSSAANADLVRSGWRKGTHGWVAAGTKSAIDIKLLAPDAASNPTANAAAAWIAGAWRAFGIGVTVVELEPARFVERLQAGDFTVALVSVNVGLDPDLYSLYASTQAVGGGGNITGLQDAALDAKLRAARAPGSMEARRIAYRNLQAALVADPAMLPLVFADELVVVSDRLSGRSVRPLGSASDRFWDVLTWRLADGR